jgi:hypothetical protein
MRVHAQACKISLSELATEAIDLDDWDTAASTLPQLPHGTQVQVGLKSGFRRLTLKRARRPRDCEAFLRVSIMAILNAC